MQGLAQEAALKMLELTAGKVVASFDTPLGFRHGPKSIVNKETLVVMFSLMILIHVNMDRLITVIHDNASGGKVIAITARNDNAFSPESFVYIPVRELF